MLIAAFAAYYDYFSGLLMHHDTRFIKELVSSMDSTRPYETAAR